METTVIKKREVYHNVLESVGEMDTVETLIKDAKAKGRQRAEDAMASLEPYVINALGDDNNTKRMVAEITSHAIIAEAKGFLEVAARSAFKRELFFEEEAEKENLVVTMSMAGDWAVDLAKMYKELILRVTAHEVSDAIQSYGADQIDIATAATIGCARQGDQSPLDALRDILEIALKD